MLLILLLDTPSEVWSYCKWSQPYPLGTLIEGSFEVVNRFGFGGLRVSGV